MRPFTFNTTPSIRFGPGALTDLVSSFPLKPEHRVLVVTDQGIVQAGLLQRLLSHLEEHRIAAVIYDGVLAEPPVEIVHEATAFARSNDVEIVIGFGGGSSLDVAKLVALLLRSDEKLDDIYGVNLVKGARLPLALIPTTAGTGSEVTPIAVVTTEGGSTKKAISSKVLLPDLAILDPELTLGLPPHVTAATGIDAMVHAIEAYTSAHINNGPVSQFLALQALSLLAGAMQTAVSDGQNLDARTQMLLGAMLAGQAFANSPVAAVHALAYPIGTRYHVAHGVSNALVLPHVLRFNAETCEAYAELGPATFPHLADHPLPTRGLAFIDELAALSRAVGIPQRLRDVGAAESDVPLLADDAMKQTRILGNNARPITHADILKIYEAAW